MSGIRAGLSQGFRVLADRLNPRKELVIWSAFGVERAAVSCRGWNERTGATWMMNEEIIVPRSGGIVIEITENGWMKVSRR